MMSASFTAARLSVLTGIFSLWAMTRARSSCATVARVRSFESSPFSRSALRRIPPILPTPSTATRLPERSNAIFSSPGPLESGIVQDCAREKRSRRAFSLSQRGEIEGLLCGFHNGSSDDEGRRRSGRWNIVDVQHVVGTDELKVVDECSVRFQCLGAHP